MTDQRPRPAPDDTTEFHWEGAASHRLLLQRCASCGNFQYPPDVCCLRCQSTTFEHVEASGQGVLYSYAIVDRPFHVGFVDSLPYVVALVELPEQPGLRMVTNLVDVPADTPLACGMPVELDFEARGDVTLPQFRLARVAS